MTCEVHIRHENLPHLLHALIMTHSSATNSPTIIDFCGNLRGEIRWKYFTTSEFRCARSRSVGGEVNDDGSSGLLRTTRVDLRV